MVVIDGGGSDRSALLGDVNAALMADNGWEGIIINGAVRDSAALRHVDLGIKALTTSPVRSAKRGVGAVGVPLVFGGVLIEHDHYVYCDEDGVLVTDTPLEI